MWVNNGINGVTIWVIGDINLLTKSPSIDLYGTGKGLIWSIV